MPDTSYSLVDAARTRRGRRVSNPAEETTPPRSSWRPTKQNAPWWATSLIALVTAIGGGAGFQQLFSKNDEQIRMLAEIQAEQKSIRADLNSLANRVAALETWSRQHDKRAEVFFAVTKRALNEEGYDVRGVDADQVEFASTRNKRKPVKAVDPSGRELEVPDATPPPGLH